MTTQPATPTRITPPAPLFPGLGDELAAVRIQLAASRLRAARVVAAAKKAVST